MFVSLINDYKKQIKLKVKVGLIDERNLKMILGPYGLNTNEIIKEINNLVSNSLLPHSLIIHINIIVLKNNTFFLYFDKVSLSSLFFFIINRMKEKTHEKFDIKSKKKIILLIFKLKLFLDLKLIKLNNKNDFFFKKKYTYNEIKKEFFYYNDYFFLKKKSFLLCILGSLNSIEINNNI